MITIQHRIHKSRVHLQAVISGATYTHYEELGDKAKPAALRDARVKFRKRLREKGVIE